MGRNVRFVHFIIYVIQFVVNRFIQDRYQHENIRLMLSVRRSAVTILPKPQRSLMLFFQYPFCN